VTQSILGIRPELDGLRIDPCLPAAWAGYGVTRRFRRMDLAIRVSNPDGVETGVASVSVDGKAVELVDDGKRGALVPVGALKDGAVLDVAMG
jgi:cellobiose phosphorylase